MTVAHDRNARIDLVRGLAIILVLLLHFSLTYPLAPSVFGAVLGADRVRSVVNNGNFGVTMFFVVSGFLITSTTMARFGSPAQVGLRRFYAFRAARILPCLVVMLAIVLALGALGIPSFQNRPPISVALTALSVLTFWHNLLMQRVGYFNYALNITWSLSVEEVFYLIFPLACVVLRRRVLLCAFWSTFIVIAPFYRAVHQGQEIPVLYNDLACFDAIAFGCLAAMIARHAPVSDATRTACRWIGAAIAVATYLTFRVHAIFGATLLAFGTALFLLGASGTSPGWFARSRVGRAIRWFGVHSYELYLFHIILLGLMRTALPRAALPDAWKPTWLALFLALAALLAWAVARYLSAPANRRLRVLLEGPRAESHQAPADGAGEETGREPVPL